MTIITSLKHHVPHLLLILSSLIISATLNLDKFSGSFLNGSLHTVLQATLIYSILRLLSSVTVLRCLFSLFIGVEFFVQLTYQSSLSISIVMSLLSAPLNESASFALTYMPQVVMAITLIGLLCFCSFSGPKLLTKLASGLGFSYLLIPFLLTIPATYQNEFYADYLHKGNSRGHSKAFSSVEYTLHKLSQRFPPFESLIAVADSVKLMTVQVKSDSSWSEVMVSESAPDLLVLGIGESLRAGNMGIYGYSRPTTPQLHSIASELTIFENVYAAGSNTWSSIPAMLTKTQSLPDLSKSIIHLANDAGYDTYWLSNQAQFGQWDFSITSLANQAQHTYFTSQDEGGSQLDEVLYEKLSATINRSGNKKLIILHFYGSHMNFIDRYNQEFSVFKSDNQTLDEYDNSVLYTDYWQKEIIDLVSDSGGEYLFFSDHGLGHPQGKMALKHDVRLPPDLESLKVPLFISSQTRFKRNTFKPNTHEPLSLFYFECLFSTWSGITAKELAENDYCVKKQATEEMVYLDANMSLRKESAPINPIHRNHQQNLFVKEPIRD